MDIKEYEHTEGYGIIMDGKLEGTPIRIISRKHPCGAQALIITTLTGNELYNSDFSLAEPPKKEGDTWTIPDLPDLTID